MNNVNEEIRQDGCSVGKSDYILAACICLDTSRLVFMAWVPDIRQISGRIRFLNL